MHSIVEQHHGRITLDTDVGRGTMIRILLPALPQPLPLDTPSEPSDPVLGGSETILLVEDDQDVRVLARFALERFGYDILDAADGPSALEVWRTHRDQIRLLLTDMIMPGGMTGRDPAKRLRVDRPDLEVIYMSGYSSDVFGKSMVLEEDVMFLQKPYRPNQLAKMVRQRLDANRSVRHGRPA